MTELYELSIAAAGREMRRGAVSPVELVDALLARIETYDADIHSVIRLLPELARDQARVAESEIRSGKVRGALHGIPYGLKDNIDYAGVATTAGSRVLRDNVARSHAPVVRNLREAGGVVVAKLALNEFAIGGPCFDTPWPPPRNPWNLEYYAGASSSGSGAAVAARFLPAAVGTDTGGSVRNPAARCGVVGLKPTYGTISRKGVVPLAYSLDHVGPLARNVEDVALLFAAMTGAPPEEPAAGRDLRMGVKGLRIGYVRHFHHDDVTGTNPEIAAGLDRAAVVLSDLGAEVREVNLSPHGAYVAVNRVITAAEGYAVHRDLLATRPGDYGQESRRSLLRGAFVSAADYLDATRVRRTLVTQYLATTRELDAVICASTMDDTPRLEDAGEIERTFSRQAWLVFNTLGVPAMTVPIGLSSAGLPFAMQIAGKPHDEATVLRIGYAYEQGAGHMPVLPALGSSG